MTEIDHVFVTVPRGGGGLRCQLEQVGLVPSYTRRHAGQGTENVCYAFDNLYLELLWECDAGELDAAAVAPTRLAARVRRTGDACPIGVGVRGGLPTSTWAWAATLLPPGMTLAVAELSRDPAMPLLFESPGTSAPVDWTDARAGERQRALGLGVADVRLRLPDPAVEPTATALGGVCDVVAAAAPGLDLTFQDGALSITALGQDDHGVELSRPTGAGDAS